MAVNQAPNSQNSHRTKVTLDYTDKHFHVEGVPRPGVPMLLDQAERFLVEPQQWLITLALDGRRPKTLRTYAEGLYDWLNHCAASGWDYRTPKADHLKLYKLHMLEATSVLGRAFAPSTINGRLRAVCDFYSWAGKHGLLPWFAVEHKEVRLSGSEWWDFLAHIRPDRMTTSNVLYVSDPRAEPRAFTRQEVEALMRALPCERDRLISRWGLYTGGRLGEIVGLRLDELPDALPGTVRPAFTRVALDSRRVKGRRKNRVLTAPRELLDDTQRYIDRERSTLLRGVPSADQPSQLWLSRGRGRRGYKAAPLTSKAYEAIIANARRSGGLSQGWFHMYRHTYAIAMLHLLTGIYSRDSGPRAGHMNALKAVKILLGHRHLSTTTIYLESLPIDDGSMSEALSSMRDVYSDDRRPEVDLAET